MIDDYIGMAVIIFAVIVMVTLALEDEDNTHE